MKEHLRSDKGNFRAIVCSQRKKGQRIYELRLEFSGAGSGAFAGAKAGQFAEIDLSSTALPLFEGIPEDLRDISSRKILLRRPFSFSDVTVKGDKTLVDIAYYVVGPATLRMTTLSQGDCVDVIGPLGNGFAMPKTKKIAVLVAGGMGYPPLLHLAKVLKTNCPDIEVIAFAGAATAEQMPFEIKPEQISHTPEFCITDFARHGVKSLVATDDGSVGFAGFVSDCFCQWLDQCGVPAEDMIVYSCGPEVMLKKVCEIAGELGVDCQVSMERRMACGIGLCQSCAVECKVNDSKETIYKLCCKDGPVFNSDELVFD